ncbi:MAG: AAA family ATPase [Candidatus Altarchaeum sp.]|nr:AAA family ATPase [Candidatus Altarchaeum sp.]
MKLFCITGMPCAGKTTAIKILRGKFPVVSMGEVIRRYIKEKNIDKDIREYSTEIRKRDKSYVAKICMPELMEMAKISKICIVEGVRNYEEVEEFRKFYDVVLIAIHASPKKRYERFRNRKRPDDNLTYDGFINRDISELSWGLGNVIALSDLIISNEEDNAEKFKENLITSFTLGYF